MGTASSAYPSTEQERCVGPGERRMSTFDIVEVFYAENEKVYRVVDPSPVYVLFVIAIDPLRI